MDECVIGLGWINGWAVSRGYDGLVDECVIRLGWVDG